MTFEDAVTEAAGQRLAVSLAFPYPDGSWCVHLRQGDRTEHGVASTPGGAVLAAMAKFNAETDLFA